jgi:hypothetical protein
MISKKDKQRFETMMLNGGIRRPFQQTARPTSPAASGYGYGNAPANQDRHSAPVPAGPRAKKPAKKAN